MASGGAGGFTKIDYHPTALGLILAEWILASWDGLDGDDTDAKDRKSNELLDLLAELL